MIDFNKRMSDVSQLFSQIQSVSRKTAKEALLSSYQDREFLKKILLYTYNPYFVYGINTQTFYNEKYINGTCNYDNIFELLDKLRSTDINDALKSETVAYIYSFEESVSLWVQRIVRKDLRIGVNIETINKVFIKLIPTFKVQLCETYESAKDLRFERYIVQPKLDGVRCIVFVSEDGKIEMYTRNGSKIEGYDTIEKYLSNELEWRGYVLDGEIIGTDFDNTMEGLFAKGTKKDASFWIYDILTIREFEERRCTKPYNERHKTYNNIYSSSKWRDGVICALEGTYPFRKDIESDIQEITTDFVNEGYEGCILKGYNSTYSFKRSFDWLKFKFMKTDEYEIIDFKKGDGDGKYKETLGAIVVEVDGVWVDVGSGFTDEQRDYIWSNMDVFYGTYAEVKYQDKTKDGSLRFPTFVKFRYDK